MITFNRYHFSTFCAIARNAVPETIARFFTNYPQLAGLRGLRFAAVIEECDRLAFNPPLKTWEGDKLHRLSQVAEVP
ncbi:MAG: hypothetical protein ACLFWI_12855 [Coleofasciculus sp.]